MKPLLFVMIVAAGLALGFAAVPAASAQEPTPLTWEPLTDDAWDVARYIVVSPGPEGDTLFASGRFEVSGVYRLDPGETAWSDDLHTPSGFPFFLLVAQTGTLLAGAGAGPTRIDRSPDGGRTWEYAVHDEHTWCLFERPSDGTLLACAFHQEDGLFVSSDDGQTWETLGPVTAETPSVANVLAEHPSAGPGGGPRLVAGVQNGLAYSDDGGMTWTQSNIWGEFRWWGDAFALAPDGPTDGSDDPGTLYAAALDFADAHAVVLASAAGGATWEERSRPGRGFPALVALADGSLLMATESEQPEQGAKVWRSFDGGRTWRDEIGGYDNVGVLDLVLGSDGRVYLAGGSGVWRTREPVPVSAEAGPEQSDAVLEVYPNPSSGSVTVAVSLPALKAVRVGVVDVLGREVAVLHEGRLGAGTTPLTFRVPGLPSGVYLVRVTGDGIALTERITLLR